MHVRQNDHFQSKKWSSSVFPVRLTCITSHIDFGTIVLEQILPELLRSSPSLNEDLFSELHVHFKNITNKNSVFNAGSMWLLGHHWKNLKLLAAFYVSLGLLESEACFLCRLQSTQACCSGKEHLSNAVNVNLRQPDHCSSPTIRPSSKMLLFLS